MKTTASVLLALAATSFAFAGDPAKPTSSDDCCGGAACSNLVSSYEKVATALAADDLAGAKAAATGDLACWAKCHDASVLTGQLEQLSAAASLSEAREVFKQVSATVIPLAEGTGTSYYVMNCPMAKADWIQTTATIANPYYGSHMLRCGSIKKTVSPES